MPGVTPSPVDDPGTTLRTYLQEARDALLAKLEGLDERALRWPRTPTGTSLVGIVKHAANVEIGYFGTAFGRAWPEPDDPCFVRDEEYDADPQADWVLAASTPAAELVAFYRRVWSFAEPTLALPLDTPGRVPWWSAGSQEVTLHTVLVHVLDDLARHAGHADVLRELADGAVGWKGVGSNVPDGVDWPAYVARLRGIAERF